jgi:hypothetical protein
MILHDLAAEEFQKEQVDIQGCGFGGAREWNRKIDAPTLANFSPVRADIFR